MVYNLFLNPGLLEASEKQELEEFSQANPTVDDSVALPRRCHKMWLFKQLWPNILGAPRLSVKRLLEKALGFLAALLHHTEPACHALLSADPKELRQPIRRYDHYCRWLTNAVGLLNHREFVAMLLLGCASDVEAA